MWTIYFNIKITDKAVLSKQFWMLIKTKRQILWPQDQKIPRWKENVAFPMESPDMWKQQACEASISNNTRTAMQNALNTAVQNALNAAVQNALNTAVQNALNTAVQNSPK